MHFRFPGLLPKDNILSLLQILASKNPSNDIAAKIILDGGYSPCQRYSEDDIFWSKNIGCDSGFIPDYINGYCLMVLPTKETLTDGDNLCKNNYDAELILFDKNEEVDSMITLIKTGILEKLKHFGNHICFASKKIFYASYLCSLFCCPDP